MNKQDREARTALRRESIPDPTNASLEAAILDQKVAGIFMDKDYAFVPVVADHGYGIGIAVANEEGYNPIEGFSTFESFEVASIFCDGMNKHIGLPQDHATGIVCSTMGGYTYRGGRVR